MLPIKTTPWPVKNGDTLNVEFPSKDQDEFVTFYGAYLPAGLSVDHATGRVSGTVATNAGTHYLVVAKVYVQPITVS